MIGRVVGFAQGVLKLFAAVQRADVAEVRSLVAAGVDVEAMDDFGTSMHRAAGEGHVDVLKVLAELGANVNSPGLLGVRPLHCAAAEGRVEAVRVLVELGADKNAPQDVHG
jgi:ankyrin repeat protein